ncbi:MAG: sensor histidine kinase [Janthinobacterium lividum]
MLHWQVAVVSLFCLLPSSIVAQRLAAPWQPDPVLSALLVQQLVFSPGGYGWVATDEGVRRYDGYAAVPLARLVRQGVAAPTGYVQLVLDPTGTLWIGAATGLFRFEPGTGQLMRQALPTTPGERSQVTALWRDARTGGLWVGYGHHRLLQLDPDRPQQPWFTADTTRGQVLRLAPGMHGTVWATTEQHLCQFDAQARQLRHLPRLAEALVPVPGTGPQLLVSATALWELDTTCNQLRERQRWLPDPHHYDVRFGPLLDAHGRPCAWLVGGRRVALRWMPGQAQPLVQCQPAGINPADAVTVPLVDRLYQLQRDPTGLEWAFSCDWRGCYRQVARPLVQRLPLPVALPSVRSLTRLPDGRLLVGSYTGTFVQQSTSAGATFRSLLLRVAGRLWPYPPYHALTTRAGRVLLALVSNGFGELNPATGEVRSLLPLVSARTLFQDSRGQVWGGGDEGLYRLNETEHRVTSFALGPAKALRGIAVRGIAEDAQGQLWLATARGVYVLDPATGALRHYGPQEPGPHHLPTIDVTCVVARAPDGRIWLGTRDAGLLALDSRRGVVRQLTATAGLPDAPVASLLPGPDGALWAGTYAGLVRYAPAADQLTVYGVAEGLTDPEFNQQAALAEATGELLFGGIGGVFRVVPTRLAPPASPAPQLLLSQVSATSNALRPLPVRTATEALALGGVAQQVRLDLALTAFRDPSQARFYYQLTPAGTPLATPQLTGHQLRLYAPAAGDYTLDLWGQTADGRRSATRRLHLTVARPWWQHPATLAGAALLLLLAGAAIQWGRSRRALREARLRTRIAADLHDEVGALLTRVSMRAEVLHETSATPNAPDLTALLADSRTALTTMRDVVWSIDAGADTVGALVDRLRDHLDQSAEPAGLRTQLVVNGLLDATPLAPHVRQHLYLLAKEAITNVVRHAPEATEIQVTLQRTGRTLTLSVRNDGPPVQRRAGSGGLGLRSMAQRAKALGARLVVGPVPGGGWEVRVVVD